MQRLVARLGGVGSILLAGAISCGKSEHGVPTQSGADAGTGQAGASLGGRAGEASIGEGGTGHSAAGAGASDGNTAGTPEAGAGGACMGAWPEQCCDVSSRLPCLGLPEAACRSAAYCTAIEGTPWTAGDPTVPEGAQVFVGCRSECQEHIGDDAFTCVLDEMNPASCFLVSSAARVPDGWSAFVDCEDMPPGSCAP